VYVSAPKTPWDRISVLFLVRLVRCHSCMRRHFRPIFLAAEKRSATYSVPRKPAAEVAATRKTCGSFCLS